MSTEPEIPFPTPEEAKKILAEEGIDTSALKAWASGKLKELKARVAVRRAFCTHEWVMTWPLDPCEYECSKCGQKSIH